MMVVTKPCTSYIHISGIEAAQSHGINPLIHHLQYPCADKAWSEAQQSCATYMKREPASTVSKQIKFRSLSALRECQEQPQTDTATLPTGGLLPSSPAAMTCYHLHAIN